MEDIKKNPDINYIFLTNNSKDFDLDVLNIEFVKNSNKKFLIFNSVDQTKQFLDEQFVLKLELHKIYEKINDKVKLKIGDLMVMFNSMREHNTGFFNIIATGDNFLNISTTKAESMLDVVARGTQVNSIPMGNCVFNSNKEEDIMGYNFRELSILDTNDIGNNIYELNIQLEVEVKYKTVERSVLIGMYHNFRDNVYQTYHIVLRYNELLDKINLISSSLVRS